MIFMPVQLSGHISAAAAAAASHVGTTSPVLASRSSLCSPALRSRPPRSCSLQSTMWSEFFLLVRDLSNRRLQAKGRQFLDKPALEMRDCSSRGICQSPEFNKCLVNRGISCLPNSQGDVKRRI